MRSWKNLSLRTRLVALYVGLLAVLLVALGGMLYNDTRNFMYTTSERRMREGAALVLERSVPGVRFFGPVTRREGHEGEDAPPGVRVFPVLSFAEIGDLMARVLSNRETTAVIYDADGQLIANGKSLPEQPLAVAV